MSEKIYDLVAIGGGTASIVATTGVAGLGGSAALIEVDRPGGDCLWTGCVPSKALLAAAKRAHLMRTADQVGIEPHEPSIDMGAVMGHVRAAQDAIEPHDSAEHLRASGVDVIEGRGVFVEPGVIQVGDQIIRYHSALVATGSHPIRPFIPGLADAQPLTSHNVWRLDALPDRLAVLGGGPIGCELGQAFGRLGSSVTIIEAASTLLPGEHPAIGEHLTSVLAAEGTIVLTGTRAEAVHSTSAGVSIDLSDGTTIEADRLFVGVGRRPNSGDLGLEKVGVAVDDRGAIEIDRAMRTTGDGVFAAGDVTATMPFTSVAADQGRQVATNSLFRTRRSTDYATIPWVTFTDPEIARVGMTAAEATRQWGRKARVERFDFADLDRAITDGTTGGWIEIVGNPRRKIVGATIVGPAAGESIAELVALMAQGKKIDALSTIVHAYPTYSEAGSHAAHEMLRARYFTKRVASATGLARKVLRRF